MRQETGFKKSWLFTLAFVVFFFNPGGSAEAEKIEETPEAVESGRKVYEKWCINCHGEKGDGKGAAKPFLFPPPRDFTMGLYKIKSTPRKELPLEEDLFKSITQGMPGTSMPGWENLSEEERWSLVHYIKTFSERFGNAKKEGKYLPAPIQVGNPIPSSPESIKLGEDIFSELECDICHGSEGRGDGFKALKLKTKWGGRVLPRNLTRKWLFRRGSLPQDIYRTIRIGVEGTPMPSFARELDEPQDEGDEDDEDEEDEDDEDDEEVMDDRKGDNAPAPKEPKMGGEERTWHLVNYVLSLSQEKKPELKPVYKVKQIDEAIPNGPLDKQWDAVAQNEYPLVGQIIIEPRLFTPRIDFVQLKGLYNKEEIAFLLTWHDPSEKTLPNPAKGFSSDAIALQFPREIPVGRKLPYFIYGDTENSVYLLSWGADKNAITEMNATGINSVATQGAEAQDATGAISFKDGEYRLLIKRSLTTDDPKDLQFKPGKFIPVAFSAWEGSNGETETKRSLSVWYNIILEAPIPKGIYYYPFLAIFGVVAVEAFIIRRLRKQKGKS